jgi:hypothetical protein
VTKTCVVLIGAALAFLGFPQALAASGCLAIEGSSAPVSIGSTLQFFANCCSGVPAVTPARLWALGGLLSLAGFLIVLRTNRRWKGLTLLCLVGCVARTASAQSCPGSGPFQWLARSADEMFSGAGASFSFKPTRPGTFVVSLRSPVATAAPLLVVVTCSGSNCNAGTGCVPAAWDHEVAGAMKAACDQQPTDPNWQAHLNALTTSDRFQLVALLANSSETCAPDSISGTPQNPCVAAFHYEGQAALFAGDTNPGPAGGGPFDAGASCPGAPMAGLGQPGAESLGIAPTSAVLAADGPPNLVKSIEYAAKGGVGLAWLCHRFLTECNDDNHRVYCTQYDGEEALFTPGKNLENIWSCSGIHSTACGTYCSGACGQSAKVTISPGNPRPTCAYACK